MLKFIKKLLTKKTKSVMINVEILNGQNGFFEPKNHILIIDPESDVFSKKYFIEDVVEINDNFFIVYDKNKKINKDFLGQKFVYVDDKENYECFIVEKKEDLVDRSLFEPKIEQGEDGKEFVVPPMVTGDPKQYDRITYIIKIEKKSEQKNVILEQKDKNKDNEEKTKEKVVIENIKKETESKHGLYIEMFKKIKKTETEINFKIKIEIPVPHIINDLMDNLNIEDNEKNEILNEYIESLIIENQKEFLRSIKNELRKHFMLKSKNFT